MWPFITIPDARFGIWAFYHVIETALHLMSPWRDETACSDFLPPHRDAPIYIFYGTPSFKKNDLSILEGIWSISFIVLSPEMTPSHFHGSLLWHNNGHYDVIKRHGGPRSSEPNAWLPCNQARVVTSHVVPLVTSSQNVLLTGCRAALGRVNVRPTPVWYYLSL